ncbi:MAG TPA: MmgE/PrpD family protein [Gammaproteobacteria bacterium]|nr:MmgE/PrpD family protein [Gammaproteobacteria bacterium]
MTHERDRHATSQEPTTAGATLALTRFLNTRTFDDLPPLAVEHAKMMLASTLSSAAVGITMDSARIQRELAFEQGGKAESTVWFDGAKLPAVLAARVNAAASDAAASDDSDMRNIAHYGTTLSSAGLALGERTRASGRDLLLAMVLGYETGGRIGDARAGGRPGMHASQLVAFASAAVSAKLLKHSDVEMAHALGIVATTVGGLLVGTNSWSREYMGANAAFAGVQSALAAGRGFTVNEDMIDGPSGFIDVYGAGAKGVAKLTADLGKSWNINEYLAIKLWPGAHPLSGMVEAAFTAAREGNVAPDDVAQILVAGDSVRTMFGSRRPKDHVEAIHSMPYFVASAIADRTFTWVHAMPEKIFDPTVQTLMSVVDPDPSPPAVKTRWIWAGTVTIVTKSGARITRTVDAPRGSAPRGIEWSDVEAKYRELMPQSQLPARRLDEILATIRGLENVSDVSRLTRLLVPGR